MTETRLGLGEELARGNRCALAEGPPYREFRAMTLDRERPEELSACFPMVWLPAAPGEAPPGRER